MGSVFDMFGPSPIRPIEHHIRKAHQCAKHLIPFFEACLNQDWEMATEYKNKIKQLEKEADQIKRELRLHLPTGLFLPVARSDLLELLSVQDKIANKAQDISILVTSRQMIIPKEVVTEFLALLHASIDASNQACKAINELDELLETGFRGSEVKIVEEMILKLDSIENDCDAKLAAARQRIFKFEKEYPPIEMMFLYKLLQWTGELADFAQAVGGRLQILIAR